MRIITRCKHIKLLHNICLQPNIISDLKCTQLVRQYVIFHGMKQDYKNISKFSRISWMCFSDDKKHFLNLEKRTNVLKDAIEQKKIQLKDTEHKIRLKGEELIRDIRHQKEITGQKLREKKDHVIKDILETKAKVKERIEEVVEVVYV